MFRRAIWNIGFVDRPISDFLNPSEGLQIRWLPEIGPGRYLADPFGVMFEGCPYVLCEEYEYKARKGKIVSMRLDHGNVSEHEVVMEMPFHLSYPFLFEHENAIYCVPETRGAKEIALYVAEEFPRKWRKVSVLANFPGVDGTIFRYGKNWWLAASDGEPNNRLFLWFSSQIQGPWAPHIRNPVKTDSRSSRPAGTPFISDSALYRPAQDCSGRHGTRVIINRITHLSPTDFKEEQAAIVEPSSCYPDGVHTLSAFNGITILDGKRFVYSKHILQNIIRRRAH